MQMAVDTDWLEHHWRRLPPGADGPDHHVLPTARTLGRRSPVPGRPRDVRHARPKTPFTSGVKLFPANSNTPTSVAAHHDKSARTSVQTFGTRWVTMSLAPDAYPEKLQPTPQIEQRQPRFGEELSQINGGVRWERMGFEGLGWTKEWKQECRNSKYLANMKQKYVQEFVSGWLTDCDCHNFWHNIFFDRLFG